MILVLSLFPVAVLALIVHGIIAASRADHLMLFHWGEREIFLFVRGKGRTYDRLPAWKLPLVALRFDVALLRALLQRHPAATLRSAAHATVHRFARLA